MISNPLNKLFNDFLEHYKKHSKHAINSKLADISEIVNYYGGVIEYDDLYEDVYELKYYIQKIDEGNFTFKIVVDKCFSDQLKNFNKGDCCSKWNIYISHLLYLVINNKINDIEVGDIITPNKDYVKEALDFIKNKDKKYVKLP